MSVPKHSPEEVFSTRPVVRELDCFLCPDIISPETAVEYFIVAIPDKENHINFHIRCFDQFAWLMMHYYNEYINTDKRIILN